MENDNQFLTFYVAGEVYALSVLNVKEIIEYSVVTKVPMMDASLIGVTNIRGNVIPIVDLGIRLNVKKNQIINKRTSIIVIEREDKVKNFHVGLVVDEVNEVYDIFVKEQEAAPAFGNKIRKEFIENIGKVNGQFIPILDSLALVDIDELSVVKMENIRDVRN